MSKRKRMRVLLELAHRVAVDEYQPQFTDERAWGLFLANGFCVIGIYTHRRQGAVALVILNNALGVWHE